MENTMKTMKKKSDEYITEHIDKAISELVHPKWKLQKAYNYYNCKRDAEQFRYLEENFGIGNPTSIEFTPLIKKHVDAMVGEFLDIPIIPKISCKDSETISNIFNEKTDLATKGVFNLFRNHLNEQVLNVSQGKGVTDGALKESIDTLLADVNKNFTSEYEKAAQNVLEYVIQSKETDLTSKERLLIIDLLVTGSAFYRVVPSISNTNIQIETLSPLNVFIDRNPESQYVKDGYRAVVRKWMSKQQILNKYGDRLDAKALEELKDMFEHYSDSSYMYIRTMENVRTNRPVSDGEGMGLQESKAIIPGFPADTYESFDYKFIPVYEVEWLDVDDKTFVMTRYEGVRIGQSIYITTGESENIMRTQDAPKECHLSVNGIYLTNRDNVPFSLVLSCSHLQDKYDVITYIRDTVLSNSGTDGDWIDVSLLPNFLGSNMTEKLMKWQAYGKAGMKLIDTAQEGRTFNNNTTFSGFTDSVKATTMQAFDLVLQRIEDQTSSITGVFKERLNGIQQRDAVSNVEAGARNSYIITKGFYQQMDKLVDDMLSDCLDLAKKVWKKGLTGTIVLGGQKKLFTALPEYFTLSDFDIHIVPSTRIMEDMKNVQQVVIEMVKAGQLEPSIIVDAMTARSLTELKQKVNDGLKSMKQEQNTFGQLKQQLEQAQQEVQQLQQQLQQSQQQVDQLNERKIGLEEQKIKNDYEINSYKAKTERNFKTNQADNDSKRTEIEHDQMYDGDQHNNTVRQVTE